MRRPSSSGRDSSRASSPDPRSPGGGRWPLLLGNAPAPPTMRSRRIAAASFGVAAVSAAGAALLLIDLHAAPFAWLIRVALGLVALVGLAAVGRAAFGGRRAVLASGTYVEADETGLTRVTAASRDLDGDGDGNGDGNGKSVQAPPKRSVIATWDAPFGVALLASYGRPTGLLAFTTPTQTRYVPARIDDRSELDDELLARIAVLADLDLVDGVASGAALTSQATAALVRHVEGRDKTALGRVFLSDGKGMPIALDRATLAVGERSFDLTSQLEWRPLMFHESTGQAAALYQATWIRQNGAEVVLVAPMPASIVPRETNAHRDAQNAGGRLGRSLTRDLRLLQAPAESPPSRDVRVAIDRPFMMAVRRVLDDAPLAARVAPVPPDPPPPAGGKKLTAHS